MVCIKCVAWKRQSRNHLSIKTTQSPYKYRKIMRFSAGQNECLLLPLIFRRLLLLLLLFILLPVLLRFLPCKVTGLSICSDGTQNCFQELSLGLPNRRLSEVSGLPFSSATRCPPVAPYEFFPPQPVALYFFHHICCH